MDNYLSIDFESWVYPDLPSFKTLKSQQRQKLDAGYVRNSAEIILSLLKKHKTKITFFIVGQLYDWYPQVIEKIAADGHEIAYHTYTHNILKTEKSLIRSLEESKRFLKRFKPKGFRAPVFCVKPEYFPILQDYGFAYDSSVYAPFSLKKVENLTQIPVSKLAGLPIGSGYCIAALGKRIVCLYKRINQQGKPFVSFVHNWQVVKPKNAIFPSKYYLLRRPFYLPYTFDIFDTFEQLLESFSLMPMEKLTKKKG